MTWPLEYQQACVAFERFMVAARDAAGLQTTNMAWTMVEGVFLTFRRRLSIHQAIEFAGVLPPLVRAFFLENWHPDERPVPFASRQVMTNEVQQLRYQHNFSPVNAIEAVAIAVQSIVDVGALNRLLTKFPKEASDFWEVPAD